MNKFDIYLDNYGIVNASKAEKNRRNVLATLTALTPKKALEMAHIRIQNGLIVVPKTAKKQNNLLGDRNVTEMPEKKAIFCDFNGVLNDYSKTSNESNPAFRLPQESCPHKIMLLVKLAIKHNADVIMTSLWKRDLDNYYPVVGRCLLNCGIDEYASYFNENKAVIRKLFCTSATYNSSSRRQEVMEYILANEYTHFVVFEDEHYIGEDLNAIMTDSFKGLAKEHITKADQLLQNAK